MWFVEQFDSFINLGICKEYPNMARPKSPSGVKVSRTVTSTNTNNEESKAGSPANVADVKAVAAGTTPAESVAAEVKTAPEPRKLEMVKTEPRKNVVVPIKLEDEIRRRAYELYLQRGSTPGSESEDWLTAEREVRRRYQKQQSA
jgi:hypothetical protein